MQGTKEAFLTVTQSHYERLFQEISETFPSAVLVAWENLRFTPEIPQVFQIYEKQDSDLSASCCLNIQPWTLDL